MPSQYLNTSPLNRKLVIIALVAAVAGCASLQTSTERMAQRDQQIFTKPLRAAKALPDDPSATLSESEEQQQQTGMEVFKAPSLSVEQAETQAREVIVPGLSDNKVSRLSFNNMPVGAFINEVFGNQLGLNFVVEPNVKNTPDLVTMRITQPVSEKELYSLATQTLRSYGVTTFVKENVLVFDFSEEAAGGETPLLISGRTLPEVPSTSRPVFYIHPLSAVTTPNVRSWLTQLFPRKELDIKEDPARNAIILVGSQRVVEQALVATRLLDKPTMEGMHSRIIRPSLSTASDLATNLEKVLSAQGYSVRQTDGTSAVRLLPLDSVGQLVVFARSQPVLEHIIDWAQTMEKERHNTIESGLFSYQVQSTQANHIVQVLNSLGVANYSGGTSSESERDNGGSGSNVNSPRMSSQRTPTNNEDAKGRYAVDEQLNTILYSGSGKDWLQVLPIIKTLDKPAPSVMVEIILAEVTLENTQRSGVEWLTDVSFGGFSGTVGTLDRLGLSGGGMLMNLNTAGATRAVLNAFYRNDKATIRSRPRIMVKSGGEASIDVGNEVPVLTQQSQSTQNPDAPVVASINYRKTGVLLDVKPTVHASGFVDVEINQELSEAIGTESSEIDSPTILNRNISTTVTLRDGGSVLIGGLISSNASNGRQGIPFLSQLPFLGKMFSSDTEEKTRTELMIMIIPYVLSSPDEAESLTDDLQRARIDEITAEISPPADTLEN
ncbi:type II and III secretion system protein [Lacimicrobium alkaliphilum]|uniref:Type II and III secretion system protein n=2 Tax=Lacimicrobium alkaliphilum TaxID=1526571 RepID=A0A0U2ZQG4_9ALTE|nr:type II and III secretion system protein [Lacimicrobium alkaliphilum]